MDSNDAAKIMGILRVAYPRYYANVPMEDAMAAVKLWTMMFKADSADRVMAAVQAFIAEDTKGFPPVVGQIKDYLHKFEKGTGDTALEAWALVRKAVSNGYYGAEAEFAKLPPDLQKLVGSPNVLRDWSQMEPDVFEGVVGSNFQRSYTKRMESVREIAKLPTEVRELLGAGDFIGHIEAGYDEKPVLPMPKKTDEFELASAEVVSQVVGEFRKKVVENRA